MIEPPHKNHLSIVIQSKFLLSSQLGKPRLGPLGDLLLVKDVRHALLLDDLLGPGGELGSLCLEDRNDLGTHEVVFGLA